MPRTAPGRWAAIFSAGLLALLLSSPLLVSLLSSVTGGDSSHAETLLAVTGVLLVALAAAAFVFGILAMVRYRERSAAVILGTVFSFVYLLFAIDTLIV